MQFVRIRGKRDEKPQHGTTRTKPAKCGPLISKAPGSNTPNRIGAPVTTGILAQAYARVFFISVSSSPANRTRSLEKLNEGIVRNNDVGADKK